MEANYSPVQVCRKLEISKSTLLRWEEKGYIPEPDRDVRGARQYSQEHIEAIAQFVRQRRHRREYERIVNGEPQKARSELKELGEQDALFKFIHLQDPTGLIELREYSPLQSSTIQELIRVAAEEYDPSQDRFWDILDTVYETSRPEGYTSAGE